MSTQPHVVVIDNRDSFIYNLVDALAGHHCTVFRNTVSVDAVLGADPDKCSAFATAGPSALAAWVQKGPIMDSFNDQALSLFRAIAGAKRVPTHRRDPTDDDFRQIIALMLARGATAAQLGALTSPQPDSPDLCPAMIMMMKTMNEDDSEGVKAVRAQFLADIAAG